MSGLAALIATAAVAMDDPLSFVADAEVRSDIVRLVDVADLSGLPPDLRNRAASAPVARLRYGEQTLSSGDVAARARAAVPALAAWLPVTDQPIRVRRTRAEAEPTLVPAAPPAAPAIQAGDPLTVRIDVGPVTVERDVRALQSGRAGQTVFVRTPEGVVLRARLAGDQ